ncbi:MAG: methyltransferase family protein [Enterobacteriaceae bacterium]
MRILPWLELKLPPVLLFFLAAGIMWWLTPSVPSLLLSCWSTLSGMVLMGISIAVGVTAGRIFRQASTTVNPLQPEKARVLVDWGIYRYSRNPMYLAMADMLLGWGCMLQSLIALCVLPLFVLYMTLWQIMPEERALRRQFNQQSYVGT